MSAAGWQVSDSPTPQNGGWQVSDAPQPRAAMPEDNPPPVPGLSVPAGLQGPPPQPSLVQKLMTPPDDAITRAAQGRSRFTRAVTPAEQPNPALRFATNFGGKAVQAAAAVPAAIEDIPGTVMRTGRFAARATPVGQLYDRATGNPTVSDEARDAAVSAGKSLIKDPAGTVGSVAGAVTGGLVTGELGEAAGANVPLPSKAALLDESAVAPETTMSSAFKKSAQDRQDAATLKALNIPAKSKLAQSHLSAAEGARPYIQGAENIEDLQGKIKAGKEEVWGPYQQAVDGLSDKAVTGPDGPTTVGQLEKDRLELSAINRGVKSGNPAALQLAQQKGLSQADLLAKEKAVQNALDPHLEAAGIKPGLIRKTFGQLSKVGNAVNGRITAAETPSRFGFGRIGNVDLRRPLRTPGEIVEGVKDIAQGRPLISGKPSDVAVKEAFRTGGTKPDLGSFNPPPTIEPKQLPAPGIPDAEYQMGGGGEGRTIPQPPAAPPASPSVITPAPDAQPQLPAQAGPEGQGVPPAQPSTAPPPVNSGTARTQVTPTAAERTAAPYKAMRSDDLYPKAPKEGQPPSFAVTPEGTAIPQRPQLQAPAPIKAPKSGVSLKVGDEITSGGKKGTVAGFNEKTGKVQIKWRQ